EIRRLLRFEQSFFGRLQIGICRAGPPHVAFGIRLFGLYLRQHFACRFLDDGDLHASCLLEADRHSLAPGGVRRTAIEVQLALRNGKRGKRECRGGNEQTVNHSGLPVRACTIATKLLCGRRPRNRRSSTFHPPGWPRDRTPALRPTSECCR